MLQSCAIPNFTSVHFWDQACLSIEISVHLARLLSVFRGTSGRWVGSWPVMVCHPWCRLSGLGCWALSQWTWVVHLYPGFFLKSRSRLYKDKWECTKINKCSVVYGYPESHYFVGSCNCKRWLWNMMRWFSAFLDLRYKEGFFSLTMMDTFTDSSKMRSWVRSFLQFGVLSLLHDHTISETVVLATDQALTC